MIVGVTMRYVLTKHEKRDCISHDWFDFFKSVNIRLVLIPNNLQDPVDYVKSLVGANFEIRNPNAHSACGCGVSVNFDMDKLGIPA